jgi:hypothetical protein
MLGTTTKRSDSYVEEEPACPAGRQATHMRLFQQNVGGLVGFVRLMGRKEKEFGDELQ